MNTHSDVRVSVVTPSYNMAERLPRCVASIAAQSYRNVEHIVVDGASTDGTVEYLADQPGLKWISEPDSGQAEAINKGLAMSSGDLLTWLNADDRLAPGAVEAAVTAAEQRPEAGLFYGDIEVVGIDDRRVLRSPASLSMESFCRGNVLSQPGTFFTRRALERVGPIDETFHLTMDFELWLRLMAAGIAAVHLPGVVASFEVHPGSKTGSRTTLEFAQEEERALLKHGKPHWAAMAIDRWFWDAELNAIADLLGKGAYRVARERARGDLHQLPPVFGRHRLFLWAAGVVPWGARLAVRFKRHRPFA
jgi:glycosyltransferase involved in cell wall biosynthesis